MRRPRLCPMYLWSLALFLAALLWCSKAAYPQGIGGVACFAFPCQSTVAALATITPNGTNGVRLVTDDDDCVVGGAAGVVLCIDTGAAWEPVGAGAGTDDQTAVEVPYSPTTPGDWTDPDPAEVLTALDDLAGRVTAEETETLAGDVTGPPFATVVGDNTHNHDTTTVSGLDAGDVTTGTFADALVSDALTVAGGAISTSTIVLDTGANPTTDGQIRWDTTTERVEIGDDGVATLELFPGAHTVDTGPSPDCSGDLTYQDGEGGCDPYTLHGSTADLATVSGVTPSGNLAAWDPSGNLIDGGAAGGGGTPGGADTQVQYNNGGAFGGDADLVWDDVSKTLTLGSATTASRLLLPLENDASTPTLAFGDGDTGFYEGADDIVFFSRGGTDKWHFFLNQFGATAVGGAGLDSANTSATNPTVFPRRGDTDLGLGAASATDLRLIASSVSAFGVTSTKATSYVSRVDAPQTATCTDSGDASAGALTLTPTTSHVQITNNDANGCDVTLSESGATDGQVLRVVVVASVGGTVNFADTVAVSELSGAFTAGVWDTLTVSYVIDRWVETSRSDN